MKISDAIKTLTEIQSKFGDIVITGGRMSDDIPLSDICVTDKEGHEIWPREPNGFYVNGEKPEIDGVFLS